MQCLIKFIVSALSILTIVCHAFPEPWPEFGAFPEVNIQMPVLTSSGLEFPRYPFTYQGPGASLVQQPYIPNYPVANQQPSIVSSSWQESQKSGQFGYQGPTTSTNYGPSNNAYNPSGSYGGSLGGSFGASLGASYGGSSGYPSNANTNYRNSGYPSGNASPNYNQGYGSRNNYNPSPNYSDSHNGYDQRNYGYPASNRPSYSQQQPSYGSDYGYPSTSYVDPHQGYGHGSYGPSESHVENNHSHDQRSYGYSHDSRHEVNPHHQGYKK